MPICGLYNKEQIDQAVEGARYVDRGGMQVLEEPYLRDGMAF